jgi:hypothetical protein
MIIGHRDPHTSVNRSWIGGFDIPDNGRLVTKTVYVLADVTPYGLNIVLSTPLQNPIPEEMFNELVSYIRERLAPPTTPPEPEVGESGGRPKLSTEELVYRLAKVQEGEEIKAQDPKLYWKEIKIHIGWPHSIKLLEDARKRLKRLEENDPNNLLEKVKIQRQNK